MNAPETPSSPESGRESRYWAFVSYSHRDAEVARRVHEWLETYRIPAAFVGRATARCERVPERLYPVFLDRFEAPGGGHLTSVIEAALQASRNLVVVSSPAAVGSRYVGLEIEHFRRLGRSDRLFPVIAHGEPFAADPQRECLHSAIRGTPRATAAADAPTAEDQPEPLEPLEPLCCDLQDHADGFERAMLKLVSGMTGIAVGELANRDTQRRQRRNRWVIAGLTLLVAVLTALSGWALFERDTATQAAQSEADARRKESDERQRAEDNARAATLARDDAKTQQARAVTAAASAIAERDRAELEQRRAEREAAVARSARLAAESQLSSNAGPEQIRLALASQRASPTLEAHQALLHASLQHAGSTRYRARLPDLPDQLLGPWPGNGSALIVDIPGPGAMGFLEPTPAVIDANDLGARPPRHRVLPASRRWLQTPAAERDVELLSIESADKPPDTCEVKSLPADGPPRAFSIANCAPVMTRSSRNGLFIAVLDAGPPPPSGGARPVRLYSVRTGEQLPSVIPVQADGSPLPRDQFPQLQGLADDGRQFLLKTAGKVWVVDVASGRSEPFPGTADTEAGMRLQEGPPGTWWAITTEGGGIERVQAWQRTTTGWRSGCAQPVTPFRAEWSRETANLKLLIAPTYRWSASRRSLASISVASGSPVLHWCHVSAGGAHQRQLEAVPASVAISPGDRLLAWSLDAKVEVVDMSSGARVLGVSVGFGMPIERLWFDADAARLWALSTNGQVTSWAMPRGDSPMPVSDREIVTGIEPAPRDWLVSGSGQFLQVSDSGRYLLLWNAAGGAAFVEPATGRFRSGLWIEPGTSQLRPDALADETVRQCLERAEACRGRGPLLAVRQVGEDDDFVFQVEHPVRLRIAEEKSEWVIRAAGADAGRAATKLPSTFGHPLDVRAVSGSGAPMLVALSLPHEAREALEDRRIAPDMVPLRTYLSSSRDGQTVYEADVAVRARRDLGMLNDRGLELVAFGPSGAEFSRQRMAGGVAWAAAPGSGSGAVAFQSSLSTLAVCGLRSVSKPGPPRCRQIELGVDEPLETVAISRDGRTVAVASARGIKVWAGNGMLITREPIRASGQRVTALALSPDGQHLYALDRAGMLYGWPLDAELLARRLRTMVAK
jgi:hypothetical protein